MTGPTEKQCLHCGAGIQKANRSDAQYRRAKYCSKACKGAVQTRVPLRIVGCANCGTPFETRRERYCSRTCCDIAKQKLKPQVPCQRCGSNFTPADKNSKFCSVRCFGESRRRHDALRRPNGQAIRDLPHVVCVVCKSEFKPLSKTTTRCSACARSKGHHVFQCVACGATARKCDGVWEGGEGGRVMSRRFYCSESCKVLFEEILTVESILHDANMLIREARNMWRISRGRPDLRFHCLTCGSPFIGKSISNNKYCSTKCSGIANVKGGPVRRKENHNG